MMAGRRDRRRPLIRSGAMAAVIARNGGSKRSQTLKNERENGRTAVLENVLSALQPELGQYLRQLSTLHAAGVLTDEEFSAARGRLFGS